MRSRLLRGAPAALAAALLWPAGCSEPSTPASSPRPDVLLISIDTLRPDRLACYGAARETAPTLDALARRGVLVEDVSATSPWTLPSHASLLTGLLPSRHGVKDRDRRLPDELPTLASELAAAGYRTHAVVNAQHVSARYGLARGFEAYDYVSEWELAADGSRRIANCAAEVGARGLQWIEGLGEDEPFFLFLHFYDVHTDLTPDPRWAREFAGEPWPGAPTGRTDELLAARQGLRPMDERDAAWLRDLYDAEIRTFDERLGALLERLEASGRAARTLVVVTSDHGEEFLEHGSLLHGRTYYQEVIAIPLLFAGPGVPAGVRLGAPASLVDVAPTILGLVGLEPPPGLDGRDLSPSFGAASAEDAQRFLFAEADHNTVVGGRPVSDVGRMVRRGTGKLVWSRVDDQGRFFDLAQDPLERAGRPPGADPRGAALLERLSAFLQVRPAAGAVLPPLSDEELERLRALGY